MRARRRVERMPQYHLSDEKLHEYEQEMVESVRAEHGETVAAMWLPSDSKYANVIRTRELRQKEFNELDKIMEPYEETCRFLALIDTRGDADKGRLIHAFRVSSSGLTAKKRAGTPEEGKPDIAFIQDLVHGGEITEEEIVSYYEAAGVNLDSCISVETNFRISPAERFNDLKSSDLGYLALFNSIGAEVGQAGELSAGVFAHMNRVAKLSLGRTGVDWGPVADRPDLMTPTVDLNNPDGVKSDPRYTPVFIPGSQHNTALFQEIGPFAPVVVEPPKPKSVLSRIGLKR
jgi:hypothetical protein